MRTVFLVALVLAFTASAALASETYSYYFNYNNGSYKVIFQSEVGAGPGYDGEIINTWPFTPSDIAITFYKQNGKDGWDGPTGFYVTDYRAPLLTGETIVVGDIYLWAQPAATPRDLQLYIRYSSLSPGLTYKLRLISIPTGVVYGGPTEWGPNHGTIYLPFFATSDFTKGYRFQAEFTAPPVPEPSSIMALAGGLIGVGGLVLRRKKS